MPKIIAFIPVDPDVKTEDLVKNYNAFYQYVQPHVGANHILGVGSLPKPVATPSREAFYAELNKAREGVSYDNPQQFGEERAARIMAAILDPNVSSLWLWNGGALTGKRRKATQETMLWLLKYIEKQLLIVAKEMKATGRKLPQKPVLGYCFGAGIMALLGLAGVSRPISAPLGMDIWQYDNYIDPPAMRHHQLMDLSKALRHELDHVRIPRGATCFNHAGFEFLSGKNPVTGFVLVGFFPVMMGILSHFLPTKAPGLPIIFVPELLDFGTEAGLIGELHKMHASGLIKLQAVLMGHQIFKDDDGADQRAEECRKAMTAFTQKFPQVPIINGLPVGHSQPNFVLPCGWGTVYCENGEQVFRYSRLAPGRWEMIKQGIVKPPKMPSSPVNDAATKTPAAAAATPPAASRKPAADVAAPVNNAPEAATSPASSKKPAAAAASPAAIKKSASNTNVKAVTPRASATTKSPPSIKRSSSTNVTPTTVEYALPPNCEGSSKPTRSESGPLKKSDSVRSVGGESPLPFTMEKKKTPSSTTTTSTTEKKRTGSGKMPPNSPPANPAKPKKSGSTKTPPASPGMAPAKPKKSGSIRKEPKVAKQENGAETAPTSDPPTSEPAVKQAITPQKPPTNPTTESPLQQPLLQPLQTSPPKPLDLQTYGSPGSLGSMINGHSSSTESMTTPKSQASPGYMFATQKTVMDSVDTWPQFTGIASPIIDGKSSTIDLQDYKAHSSSLRKEITYHYPSAPASPQTDASAPASPQAIPNTPQDSTINAEVPAEKTEPTQDSTIDTDVQVKKTEPTEVPVPKTEPTPEAAVPKPGPKKSKVEIARELLAKRRAEREAGIRLSLENGDYPMPPGATMQKPAATRKPAAERKPAPTNAAPRAGSQPLSKCPPKPDPSPISYPSDKPAQPKPPIVPTGLSTPPPSSPSLSTSNHASLRSPMGLPRRAALSTPPPPTGAVPSATKFDIKPMESLQLPATELYGGYMAQPKAPTQGLNPNPGGYMAQPEASTEGYHLPPQFPAQAQSDFPMQSMYMPASASSQTYASAYANGLASYYGSATGPASGPNDYVFMHH